MRFALRLALFITALCTSPVALPGCGGDTQPVDDTMGFYSCDTVGVSGAHACIDYQWEGGSYSSTEWAKTCKGTGSSTSKCNHAGAVGGCQQVVYAGSVVITQTTWFYSGRASDLQQSCPATWVMP